MKRTLICLVTQNIQQINETGHSVRAFIITAVVPCASAALAWLATASFESFRRRVKGNSDEHPIKILFRKLSLAKDVLGVVGLVSSTFTSASLALEFYARASQIRHPSRRTQSEPATSTMNIGLDGADTGHSESYDGGPV